MILQKIQQRWQAWRDRKFLDRHNCDTWEEYHRVYDPDYDPRASRIRDYYHGYPYVYCFENLGHYSYKLIYDYGPGGIRHGFNEIQQQVKNSAKHKVRFDFLRVHKQGANGNVEEEWWINEIGGEDFLFVAFKNEQDYLMFMLRWA